MPREEFEFKFRVDDSAALDRLREAVMVPGAPVPPALRQVNRFFDTPTRELGTTHRILRLREEAGRFLLTAKGPGSRLCDEALAVKAEEEAEIEEVEASAILAGTISPLELLIERQGAPLPPLLTVMRELVGGRPLAEVGSFTNDRRRVGPVRLDTEAGPVEVFFELDRSHFPHGVVHFEVEVEVPGPAAEACRAALFDLLARFDVAWRPSSSKARRFFDLLDRP